MFTTEMLVTSIIEGVGPLINIFFLPIILWVVFPGILFSMIVRIKGSYQIGAFLGLVALLTIGPWSILH